MELNPNHKVTKSLHDHWHKIVAFIMHKHGLKEVVITAADIALFSRELEGSVVVAHDKADGLHIILTTEIDAIERIAKQGGRG